MNLLGVVSNEYLKQNPKNDLKAEKKRYRNKKKIFWCIPERPTPHIDILHTTHLWKYTTSWHSTITNFESFRFERHAIYIIILYLYDLAPAIRSLLEWRGWRFASDRLNTALTSRSRRHGALLSPFLSAIRASHFSGFAMYLSKGGEEVEGQKKHMIGKRERTTIRGKRLKTREGELNKEKGWKRYERRGRRKEYILKGLNDAERKGGKYKKK